MGTDTKVIRQFEKTIVHDRLVYKLRNAKMFLHNIVNQYIEVNKLITNVTHTSKVV